MIRADVREVVAVAARVEDALFDLDPILAIGGQNCAEHGVLQMQGAVVIAGEFFATCIENARREVELGPGVKLLGEPHGIDLHRKVIAFAARDAIHIDIANLSRIHAAKHRAVHRHLLVFLRFIDDGKARHRKGAKGGQLSGGAQLERVQSQRAIGIDLKLRLHAVLDETTMDRAAGFGQRWQAFQLHTADARTIKKDLLRLLDEGTLNGDLNGGAALACARRDILNVMNHRACERRSEQAR